RLLFRGEERAPKHGYAPGDRSVLAKAFVVEGLGGDEVMTRRTLESVNHHTTMTIGRARSVGEARFVGRGRNAHVIVGTPRHGEGALVELKRSLGHADRLHGFGDDDA